MPVLFAFALCLAPNLSGPDTWMVDRRVEEWQPTTRERRWEQIGWANDLLTARKLSREHKRPVFLFTHDGKLNIGRC